MVEVELVPADSRVGYALHHAVTQLVPQYTAPPPKPGNHHNRACAMLKTGNVQQAVSAPRPQLSQDKVHTKLSVLLLPLPLLR